MERTWKPTTAGILNIGAGTLSFCVWIPLLVITLTLPGVVTVSGWILVAVGIICFAFGVVAIIGGYFSLRRRIWGLALAGSIAALLTTLILGVLSIVFVSLSKREFAQS